MSHPPSGERGRARAGAPTHGAAEQGGSRWRRRPDEVRHAAEPPPAVGVAATGLVVEGGDISGGEGAVVDNEVVLIALERLPTPRWIAAPLEGGKSHPRSYVAGPHITRSDILPIAVYGNIGPVAGDCKMLPGICEPGLREIDV